MRQYKKWSNEELEFLYSNVGKMKLTTIALKLNRTVSAVKVRISKLGLNISNNSGLYTVSYISKCFGSNHTTFYKKLKSIIIYKNIYLNKKIRYVRAKDFWKFVKNNKELFSLNKYKKGSILPEPGFMKGEIKQKNLITYWSEYDVRMLRFYVNKGLSHKEIAKKLNKTIPSVKTKASRLNHITQVHLKWSSKEIEILKSMLKEGKKHSEIAEELGRETYHITDYIYRNNLHDRDKVIRNTSIRWTNEEIEKLEIMISQGYNYTQISKELNRSYYAICHKIKRIRDNV